MFAAAQALANVRLVESPCFRVAKQHFALAAVRDYNSVAQSCNLLATAGFAAKDFVVVRFAVPGSVPVEL
jgi:hypothetical protein